MEVVVEGRGDGGGDGGDGGTRPDSVTSGWRVPGQLMMVNSVAVEM